MAKKAKIKTAIPKMGNKADGARSAKKGQVPGALPQNKMKGGAMKRMAKMEKSNCAV